MSSDKQAVSPTKTSQSMWKSVTEREVSTDHQSDPEIVRFPSFVSRFHDPDLFSFFRIRLESTWRIAFDLLIGHDRCDSAEIRSLILTRLEDLDHRKELIGNDGSKRCEAL